MRWILDPIISRSPSTFFSSQKYDFSPPGSTAVKHASFSMALQGTTAKTRSKIRLLELEPAENIGDPIVGRIITLSSSEDAEYIAISALHGDLALRETVTLGHRKVTVPLNLAQAIRHTRFVFQPSSSSKSSDWLASAASRSSGSIHSSRSAPTSPAPRSPKLSSKPGWIKNSLGSVRLVFSSKGINSLGGKKPPTKLRLWIDYLCLNKIDPQEQGTQRTDLMRIHQEAKAVVGWLGMKEKDGTTDEAINTIEFVDGAVPRNWGNAEDKQKYPENYSPRHEFMNHIAHFWAPLIPFVPPKDYGGLDDFERTKNRTDAQAKVTGPWISVARFLTCEYFTRSWILDEIAFAKFPVFLVGDRILNWEHLLRLARLIEELRDTESNVFPANLKPIVHDFPLGIVWTLLKEFENKQKEEENKQLESTTCAQMSVTSLPRTTLEMA